MKEKIVTPPNVGEDAEKLYHSYTIGANVKRHRHSRKELGNFSTKLNIELL